MKVTARSPLTNDEVLRRLDRMADLAREALGSRALEDAVEEERLINEAVETIKSRLLVIRRGAAQPKTGGP